jgi:hypothetical protein
MSVKIAPDIVRSILSTNDYSMLYTNFKSYGEIVNYCLKYKIPLTRHQRTTMLAYQWSGDHLPIQSRL